MGDSMLDNIENLKLINIYDGISASNAEFKDRAAHCLVFKISGESEYKFKNKILILKAGQTLFIPKGADYLIRKISDGTSRYVVINFHAVISDAEPKVYDTSRFSDTYNDFKIINKTWLFNNSSGNYKCISLFYKILSDLCNVNLNNYKNNSQKNLIKESLEYLEENIFDCRLNIAEIIAKSNVSGTYFRNIFMSIYGITPKKYIINKRLVKARNIFDGGEFDSISRVAEIVGFDDALYFGKLFKLKYGITPSEYIKIK